MGKEDIKLKLVKAEAVLEVIRLGSVAQSWMTVKSALGTWFGNESNKSVETGPENSRGPGWFGNDGIDCII